MFGFILKKSFCDTWDNLFTVVIVNVIILFSGFGLALLGTYTARLESDLLLWTVIILSVMIFSILIFAYGDSAAAISDFSTSSIKEYFKRIPSCIKDGALFGLMISLIGIISFTSVSYYWSEEFLSQATYLGVILGSIILWLDIFCILSLQWFLPIRSLMHNNFKKCLKKSFIIFFDNTAFSIMTALYNLVMMIFSVAFIGFVPAAAGILIADTDALRLRLYKYDYLEEHPELKTKQERNNIPWEELIYDDREALGPRKLKSFIFPWKE